MKTTIALFLMYTAASVFAVAQNANMPPGTQKSDQDSVRRETYRLEYTISEVEDGKKLNARSYTVNCEDRVHPKCVLKVGSRVPVVTGTTRGDASTQWQYIDVGINIDAVLENLGGGELSLQSALEMSNVADSVTTSQGSNPVIRQVRVDSSNVITPGKPVMISTADDMTTHRQYQIQITATKVK